MDDSLPFSLPENSESLRTVYNDSTNIQTPVIEEEENDDGVAKTPDEVLNEMKTAWINENCSPVLLPHKYEAAECLLDQIDNMESNIDSCKNKGSLKVAAHKMELLRISYMVNDYLRLRLEKIEKNSRGTLRDHNSRILEGRAPLLAEEELEFLAKFAQAEAKLLASSLLGKLPPAFRKIPVVEINTEFERVFARVTAEDAENVLIPDYQNPNAGNFVDMEMNSVHLIPFKSIQEHVENGKAQLM